MMKSVMIVGAMTLGIAVQASADEVRLRASVRLPARATHVHLRDVADLEGPLAEGLGDVILADAARAGEEVIEISVADVRQALTTAGARWGQLNLSGQRVIVRPLRSDGATAPLAMSAASLVEGREDSAGESRIDAVTAASLAREATLRGEVARFLVAHLEVQGEDLCLEFRGPEESILRTPIGAHRLECEPYGEIDNDVLSVAVRAWEGGQVSQRWTVRVAPTIRCEALVTTRAIRRHDPITAADVRRETCWLAPRDAAAAVGSSELRGVLAAGPLEPGRVLSRSHLHAPSVVRRGDQVMIRCLVGGLVLSLKAEARQDGAAGETIEFRKGRERDTFLATVTGPGEAVVELGE